TLHPSPFTLHPAPCTLHPPPFTLHPAPCTLHPAPFTLHPAPDTLHPTLCNFGAKRPASLRRDRCVREQPRRQARERPRDRSRGRRSQTVGRDCLVMFAAQRHQIPLHPAPSASA
ncbi:hypothetical protein T484DRAFT_1649186, partial [Baffinella frigidus]